MLLSLCDARIAHLVGLLDDIAKDTLPARPNRHEPRVVKRRPKPFPRMRQPRTVLKAKMAA